MDRNPRATYTFTATSSPPPTPPLPSRGKQWHHLPYLPHRLLLLLFLPKTRRDEKARRRSWARQTDGALHCFDLSMMRDGIQRSNVLQGEREFDPSQPKTNEPICQTLFRLRTRPGGVGGAISIFCQHARASITHSLPHPKTTII